MNVPAWVGLGRILGSADVHLLLIGAVWEMDFAGGEFLLLLSLSLVGMFQIWHPPCAQHVFVLPFPGVANIS